MWSFCNGMAREQGTYYVQVANIIVLEPERRMSTKTCGKMQTNHAASVWRGYRNWDSRITFPATTTRNFPFFGHSNLVLAVAHELSKQNEECWRTNLLVSAYEIKQTLKFNAESLGGGGCCCCWCCLVCIRTLQFVFSLPSSAGVCETLFRISCRVWQFFFYTWLCVYPAELPWPM